MQDTLRELVKQRFSGFTEIQKKAIPLVEQGKNCLIIAPTGFGKTEAAILPILAKLLTYEKIGVQALYITPLKSLNRDMLERTEWWCHRLGITLGVRHGDTSPHERQKQAKKPPQLLITTPETLQAMLPSQRMGGALVNVKHVIVDEVHSIFDNKRGCQLSLSLERLEQRAPNFQRIGLSATIGDVNEAAEWLCGQEMAGRKCETVTLNVERKMDITVESPKPEKRHEKLASEMFIETDAATRLERVHGLVEKNRALVFTNTRQVAETLSSRLIALGAPIAVHHGSLSKEVRLSAEQRFKKGQVNALLCTSSLELGIDIGDIGLVVQYLSPRQVSRLVQRVGRSGHSHEKMPKGIIIAGDIDDVLESQAVAKLAHEGKIEAQAMEHGALDVVAQQISGIVLERGEAKLEEIHETLSRSAAYGISEEKLSQVCAQLASERIVHFSPELRILKKSAATREYYYSRLSTIPSERKFRVKNAVSNSYVSMLDEAFVAELFPGSGFITKGVPWHVLDIDEKEREIVVEPADDFTLAVPDWTGDEIPVPFAVAQEVGRMRHHAKELGQKPLPDHENAVIEVHAELVVIHACWGSLANATIGRALSWLLTSKFGTSVRTVTDPYRIILELPRPMQPEKIGELLLSLGNIEGVVNESLYSSSLLRFKFIHVARLFGLLSDDAMPGRRLIEALRNTVVYEEALRSVKRNYLDIRNSERILNELRQRKIKLHYVQSKELSKLARLGISRVHASELIAPIEPKGEIVRAFKRQLLDKMIKFKCTYCKKTFFNKLSDAPQKIKCVHCGSSMVAYLGEFKPGKPMREKESKEDEELSASLIEAYGKKAAMAMSAYGVGPKTAAFILRKLQRDEDSFVADILEAQKQFIRTKRYWQL